MYSLTHVAVGLMRWVEVGVGSVEDQSFTPNFAILFSEGVVDGMAISDD